MPSLERHVVNGKAYWRIVESRRVNGKPRPVPILYLGTVDQILDKLLRAPAGNLRIQSFQHGDVAALKAAADRLDVVGIIDRHVSQPTHHLPSVGTTLLLGALNRAVQPRSKRGWADWAAGTSLPRLFPGLDPRVLTSQFFWDQMNSIDLDTLRAIESDLVQAVIREMRVSLDLLFYDTTNFFTYIASDNARPQLPQRGKNKQRRIDLRQFGLALLVARDKEGLRCLTPGFTLAPGKYHLKFVVRENQSGNMMEVGFQLCIGGSEIGLDGARPEQLEARRHAPPRNASHRPRPRATQTLVDGDRPVRDLLLRRVGALVRRQQPQRGNQPRHDRAADGPAAGRMPGETPCLVARRQPRGGDRKGRPLSL